MKILSLYIHHIFIHSSVDAMSGGDPEHKLKRAGDMRNGARATLESSVRNENWLGHSQDATSCDINTHFDMPKCNNKHKIKCLRSLAQPLTVYYTRLFERRGRHWGQQRWCPPCFRRTRGIRVKIGAKFTIETSYWCPGELTNRKIYIRTKEDVTRPYKVKASPPRASQENTYTPQMAIVGMEWSTMPRSPLTERTIYEWPRKQ